MYCGGASKASSLFMSAKKGEIFMKFINVGFGNMVSSARIVTIVCPDAAPIKRVITDARNKNELIDATCGRRPRAVIVTDSRLIILSALQPETISNRLKGDFSNDEGDLDLYEQ